MWEIIRDFVKNRFFTATIRVPKDYEVPVEYILKDLASKVVEEIIEKKAYVLESKSIQDPFNPETEYSLYVAIDPDVRDSYVRPDKRFTINGIRFSDDEIRKALIKTYPQKLI